MAGESTNFPSTDDAPRRQRALRATAAVVAGLIVVGGFLSFALFQRQRFERDAQVQQAAAERLQQACDELQQQRNAALQAEVLGLAELRAGKFASAARVFQSATFRIQAVPELAELQARLAERQLRARRLATFDSLRPYIERGPRMAAELVINRSDLETSEACRAGLQALNVLEADLALGQDQDTKWWQRLPADDLTPEQRRRLEHEAGVALGMLALGRVKELAVSSDSAGYREARTWLEWLQDYHLAHQIPPSQAVDSLDTYCRWRLGESPPIRTAPGAAQGASDNYYLGLVHLYLDGIDLTDSAQWASVPRTVQEQLGLDLDHPRQAAEQHLRETVALEPGHYWAHYYLGQLQERDGNLPAAEQCYDACLKLQLQYSAAYLARASVLFRQMVEHEAFLSKATLSPEEEAASRMQLMELELRVFQALDQGLANQPREASLHWLRAQALMRRQRGKEALAEINLIGSLEATSRIAAGRQDHSSSESSAAALVSLNDWPTDDRGIEWQAARASLHLALGQNEPAQQLTDAGLATNPTHPESLAVRGTLRLEEQDWQGAHDDFQRVLSVQPQHPLAALGLAWTHEGTKNWRASLAVFDRLLEVDREAQAGDDWFELALHLGRARALHGLGKMPECELALEQALGINPLTTAESRERLFGENSN